MIGGTGTPEAPDPARATARSDRSISMEWANLVSVPVVIASGAMLALPFNRLHESSIFDPLLRANASTVALGLVVLLAGIYAHEWIHAWAFRRVGGAPTDAVRISVNWKVLTPFAGCSVPIEARAYRWTAGLPAIVLGFLPYALGILTGSELVAFWGMIFVVAGAGDFMVLWLIRDLPGDAMVSDHPTRCGCEVLP